jgi:tRNA nucleotidyltransferase/poly(A) polymerase
VRDQLLGRDTRDFDLLVEASLEATRRLLSDAKPIGARTPVLLIPEDDDGPQIEVTALSSGTGALEENLGGRDFTLNAIALDPMDGTMRDPFNGRRHLENRLLVAVDVARVFREDPLRILRGVRLALELSLDIDPETQWAMGRDAWRLCATPGERLREELFRLLALPGCSRGVEELRSVGALAVVLPGLLRTVGVAQNRHHPDDVYRHTLRVTDALPPEPLLRLAALLHDAAKPETKRFERRRGDFSFLRHDLLGARHVARVVSRLRLSRREETTVERLVRHHLIFPARLETDRAIRRLLRRVGDDILPGLLELRRADLRSRNPSGSTPPEWEDLVRRIQAVAAQQEEQGGGRLAMSGRDVMETLGLPEGRAVGRWLQRARQRVLDRPEENDRERLIAWLRSSASVEEDGCTRR